MTDNFSASFGKSDVDILNIYLFNYNNSEIDISGSPVAWDK